MNSGSWSDINAITMTPSLRVKVQTNQFRQSDPRMKGQPNKHLQPGNQSKSISINPAGTELPLNGRIWLLCL